MEEQPAVPQLVPDGMLRRSTQILYRRTHQWLQRVYPGPWTHTAPLQAWMDAQQQSGSVRPMRLRTVQGLINRHVHPRPAGPPLRFSVVARQLLRKRGEDAKEGEDNVTAAPLQQLAAWVPARTMRVCQAPGFPLRTEWMRAYVAALSPSPWRKGRIRTYAGYVGDLLFGVLGLGASADDLLSLRRDAVMDAILSSQKRSAHTQRLCRVAWNHFVADVAFREAPTQRVALTIGGRELRRRAAGRPDALLALADAAPHPALAAGRWAARDHFETAEVTAMLALRHLSLRDQLVLRVLAETGLRRRAVAWLLVDRVYDRMAGRARPVAEATEKGLVTRPVMFGDTTRELLERYLASEHPGGEFLFPNRRDTHFPVSGGTINAILQRACVAAGVRGRHCHAHGMRKFVVCRLMQEQNRLEDVSKWLGHRALNTTYTTYWDVQPTELVEGMSIPWLEDASS